LTCNNYARWHMSDTHSRICRVNVLSTSTSCTICLKFEVSWINLDVNLFSFRQYRHCSCRCMYATLRFGIRYTLNPVHTAFVFHLSEDLVPAQTEGDLFKSTFR